MGSALRLQSLLASGQVRWSSSFAPREPAGWDLDGLSGRVVELVGGAASALLTAAAGLVRAAQLERDTAAWITHPTATFFPPDVADHGVDLGALAVVQAETTEAMLRAADCLLRSGGFGLVVVDFVQGADIPMSAQVRLLNLTKRHGAVLVCLFSGGPFVPGGVRSRVAVSAPVSAVTSLASLRAESTRRRIAPGRFECTLDVSKDKLHGGGWQHAQVLDGALGLR